MSRHFEKEPLLVRRGYVSRDIGWDEINHAVFVGDKDADFIRLHKDGFVDPDVFSEYCSDVGTLRRRLNRTVVRGMLGRGAVLIFNRIDLFSFPVSKLCEVVAKLTGFNAVANCYVAFKDRESFGKHWDTHDVFAVQLVGRKRWLVYEPTVHLPTSGQTSLEHKHECPAEPVMDVILEAGDVLYLPRGWWHTAIPLNEETSHLAIGIHAPTVIDYVRWSLDRLASTSDVLRRSVRQGAEDLPNLLHEALESFGSEVFSKEAVDRYFNELRKVERTASMLDFSHGFVGDTAHMRVASFTINSKRTATDIRPEMVINGSKLHLNENAQRILRVLAASVLPTPFEDLCAVLPDVAPATMEAHLNEFIAYDVIMLHRAAAN
jgi:ribosomal protein L16 Arg81 hydroxylase